MQTNTKQLNKPSRLVQTILLSGVTALLAGCPTTQGPSSAQQPAQPPTRTTAVAQAPTNAPVTVTPAVPKQQVAAASPAPAAVQAPAQAAAKAVATVSYQELVKHHADDAGDPRKAYGKTVQVAVTGKGEVGYFSKRVDGVTFLCDTGNKTLTTNKGFKGNIRGMVVESQPWEGATVYRLKDCQIVK